MVQTNPVPFFANTSFVIQCMTLLLLGLSVISWTIIFRRMRLFRRIVDTTKRFEERFWSGIDLAKLYQEGLRSKSKPSQLETIFQSGFKTFSRFYAKKEAFMNRPEIAINAASRSMHNALYSVNATNEQGLPWLATIASVSPYIGLLGTVWGIIQTFIALGGTRHATLQMVAPGISEALISTALGLFVAIPAVFAHQRYTVQLSQLEQRYSQFIEEFLALLDRQSWS